MSVQKTNPLWLSYYLDSSLITQNLIQTLSKYLGFYAYFSCCFVDIICLIHTCFRKTTRCISIRTGGILNAAERRSGRFDPSTLSTILFVIIPNFIFNMLIDKKFSFFLQKLAPTRVHELQADNVLSLLL